MCHLPGEEMVLGCTVRRWQCSARKPLLYLGGCYFDTCHLRKHSFRTSTALHGKDIPLWQWAPSAGQRAIPHYRKSLKNGLKSMTEFNVLLSAAGARYHSAHTEVLYRPHLDGSEPFWLAQGRLSQY